MYFLTPHLLYEIYEINVNVCMKAKATKLTLNMFSDEGVVHYVAVIRL